MNWIARLFARLVVTDAWCWEWSGCRDVDGYGRVKSRDRALLVHRVVWEVCWRQEIPPGWDLHHVCGNRACANPAHVECVRAPEHRRWTAWRKAVA